jgi:3',5'-cyclic AMP phosphodiesterase CpdA
MKIVQISDTHLSRHGGTTNENLLRVATFLNEVIRPDAVVHTGDVIIMDPDVDADRVAARDLLARIDAPLHVVPGNHDIGDSAQPWVVSSERVQAHRAVFGEDRWVRIAGDVALVGLNSEILASGLPEEDEQWAWLETLPEQVDGRRAIVFCHKPLVDPDPAATHPMSIPAAATPRLRELLGRIDVVAYGSGHLHRYLLERDGGAWAVSAPATAFTAGSAADYPGLRQLGFVEYDVTADAVTPVFRSVHTLLERDLMDLPEARRALEEAGIVLPA